MLEYKGEFCAELLLKSWIHLLVNRLRNVISNVAQLFRYIRYTSTKFYL